MTSKNARCLAAGLALLLASTACERELTDLDPATFPSIAEVFIDDFSPGLDFAAFGGSRLDALSIDNEVTYEGTAALRFEVPAFGDPSGSFAGGTFTTSGPRDLSPFNALTFWARASRNATLNEVGFGDDGGASQFKTSINNLALFTSWQQYVVPIPAAGLLTSEGGMFWIADGTDDGDSYTIWIDEVKFENLAGLGAPDVELFSRTVGMAVGDVVQADVTLEFAAGASTISVNPSLQFFTWTSSNPSVATVSATGLITKVAEGTAQITAELGSFPVAGAVAVEDGDGLAGVVFDDAFGAAVGFASFGDGAKTDALSVETEDAFRGSRSIRITVPAPGDPSGTFAGGVLNTAVPRDLSGFNALVFWAKASSAVTLDVAGFGNDNSGSSRYVTDRTGLPLTTDWQRFVIPVPNPARLDAEGGLFTFAEGSETGGEYSIWFDEIAFVDLDELGALSLALTPGTFSRGIGESVDIGYTVSFPVGTETVTVSADARYFDWASSDEAVATVDENGVATVVGDGQAIITASAGAVQSTGDVFVGTGVPPSAPAPAPTQDAADVVSIYSNSYTNNPNEGLNRYGGAIFEEVDIAGSGNTALRYAYAAEGVPGRNFQIIELGGANIIDAVAEGMTNFRFDVWVPGDVTNAQFVVGLVNIDPANPPASRSDVVVNATSSPTIAQGQWLSFDVPLTELTALTGTSHIQQIAIDLQSTNEIYLDNLYLYGGGGGGPFDGGEISNGSFETGDLTDWITPGSGSATVVGTASNSGASAVQAQVGSLQNIFLQQNGVASGTVADGDQVDISFFMRGTLEAGAEVQTSLAWEAASTGLITPTGSATPSIVSSAADWTEFTFSTTVTGGNLANGFSLQIQLVCGGAPACSGDVFFDDISLTVTAGGGGGGGGAPTAPAPVPTQAPADVLSVYSDSYANNANEGFNRYGGAIFEEVDIAGSGNSALRYETADPSVPGFPFQIIELGGSNVIDLVAAGMTNLRFDVYFPTIAAGNEWVFGIVDIDPAAPASTRHNIRLRDTSTPAIAQGAWLSVDVLITDLVDLGGTSHIQQFVIDMINTAEVYVDNIYFYR